MTAALNVIGAAPKSGHNHGSVARTAVLLINLGTPDAPDAGAVRRYLRQFLSDPRVVEIPRLLWWPILHGLILPTRPRASAAKYATVWTERGSPLLVNSKEQATLLRGYLGHGGVDVEVALAMRYGNPSISSVLRELQDKRVERLLIVPMYPQYSAATTASALDEVFAFFAAQRNVPEVRWIRHFHDDAGYIAALRQSVLDHWRARGGGPGESKLLMSFHGIPRRNLELGDPYHCECQKTGRLLAEALGLSESDFLVTFQSRFGRAAWLEPYTAPSLERLAREGVAHVDVICPGFPADCLETLEEIAIEGRQAFMAAGGKQFSYIPCLNGAPAFIHALEQLATRHLQGWPVAHAETNQLAAEAERSRVRALRMGATG